MFKKDIGRVVSGSMLIAGTTIGAGMLGIPLLTAKAGFWPAWTITILTWLFMLFTGLLFLEATLWMPTGSHVLSISQRLLGKKGKVVTGALFIFLYYSLLVAYFAAGAPLLSKAFATLTGVSLTGVWSTLFFGAIFTAIVTAGARFIDRTNLILIVGMVTAYLFLIAIGAPDVESERLSVMDWSACYLAAPVLFSAFGYHNIIPSLATYFDKRKKPLVLSIFLGTTLSLVIYLVWQWLVLGLVPISNIEAALAIGAPVTEAMQAVTKNPWIFRLGQAFAFFAIVTSLLGVSFSMVDFLGDGLKMERRGSKRFFLTCLTFFPPFLFATIDPTIFDRALGVAGGFGEAVLNGLIPIALVWMGRYVMKIDDRRPIVPGGRMLLVVLSLFALGVIAVEMVSLLQGGGG